MRNEKLKSGRKRRVIGARRLCAGGKSPSVAVAANEVSEIGNDTGTAARAVPSRTPSSTQLLLIRTRTFGLGLTKPGRTRWKRREGLPHHPTFVLELNYLFSACAS